MLPAGADLVAPLSGTPEAAAWRAFGVGLVRLRDFAGDMRARAQTAKDWCDRQTAAP